VLSREDDCVRSQTTKAYRAAERVRGHGHGRDRGDGDPPFI